MVTSDKGLFIAIEGIHGCGKTTTVKHLTRLLDKDGYSVMATREIGGSLFGRRIREFVDDMDDEEDAEASLLLILAARAKHVRQVIRPNLARDKIVITDRFTPSTYIYQYYCVERLSPKEGLLDTVKCLNDFATDELSPHLTIVLDAPANVALSRKSRAQAIGKWERRGLEYHQKAREGYLHFAKLENWHIVDASRPLEAVLEDVERLVIPLLSSLGKVD